MNENQKEKEWESKSFNKENIIRGKDFAILLNLGSGACNVATEKNAIINIQQFVKDCNAENIEWRRYPSSDYGEGRFAFKLWKNDIKIIIQMPGLPLDEVRYMDSETQSCLNFPRLYVDDNSYWWYFALLEEKDFKEADDDDI